MKQLKDSLAHMHWADAGMWRALLACEAAHENERILSLSYHLHLVQHAFLHVWKEDAFEVPKADSFPALHDIAVWGKSFHPAAASWLETANPDAFDDEVTVPWSYQIKRMFDVVPGPVTLAETFTQVAMHTQYHRAQINMLLRALDGTPAHGDYISWIWLQRPEADWPAL
ncbi:hypothetical protein KQI65_09940 [bacterium]|nr:hypothetical protein [bacterium]